MSRRRAATLAVLVGTPVAAMFAAAAGMFVLAGKIDEILHRARERELREGVEKRAEPRDVAPWAAPRE